MLTLLLGVDWTVNRDKILSMIAQDVSEGKDGRILMVPELISHDTERRLCARAGDTTSRFAEVLTFTRLVKRVSDTAGFGVPDCLDNGGRLVAMASATRQLHSKLKAYASVETRPEFLSGLLDVVDEFKRCCISSADLQSASRKSQGSFAQKLEELSLILEAYDSQCAHSKLDPRDQMTWLLEQLEDCDFAKKHTFYIYGFPDFTRQHMEIISHMISNSANVVISLTCDDLDSDSPAFEKASATATELLRIAKIFDVQTRIIRAESTNRPIGAVLPFLFQGKKQGVDAMLRAHSAGTVYKECHNAAEIILGYIHSGCRFRDISVVCGDIANYRNTLNMVFSRYHIPIYISGSEDILDRSVIVTVISAIDAVVNGFEQSDVLRYLKSALSPVDIDICDRIENYVLLWNISGGRWESEWEYHPGGLSADWTSEAYNHLAELNHAKTVGLLPLFTLKKSLTGAKSVNEMVAAVYFFLKDIRLDLRLQTLASEMESDGNLRNTQILNQLWEILLAALSQLDETLGQTFWDLQTFTKLLKLLLSQYDVGTIPATLDAVTVGAVSAMRCQQPKHLLVLGAVEGCLPGYSGSVGIFSDQERNMLRQLGVPLTGGALEGLQTEFSEIYDVFCGADSSVDISYSGDEPSFLYRRIREMAGGEDTVETLGFALSNPDEVGAYLVRAGSEKMAESMGIEQAYIAAAEQTKYTFGKVDRDSICKLYGSKLTLSASQVDKLADCRLAYFLRYGLRLKERKPATVDPAEFGTYVHAVLEATGRKVMELGGFHCVSLEDTLHIANDYSRDYISQHFHQMDSQRISYLFQRNTRELELVVTELWQELLESDFEPADFELGFGTKDGLDPILLNGSTLSAQLRGFVDRVDIWNQNGQLYYRVVDYKTGKKDFDYCDIYNGLGLQMLLYMFALEEIEYSRLGDNAVAAGVQYFPARVPIVSADGRPNPEATAKEREGLWKRRGLLLADEAVLSAMDPSENATRLSCSRKKDGTISGDLADRQQMELLKGYVFALLGKMIDDVASGDVEPNPYTRGSRHNACSFCPYGAICRESAENGRRDYAAMSAEQFWEALEKEGHGHG